LKPGRTIPPAAAPVRFRDLLRGLSGLFRGRCCAELEAGFRHHFGADFALLTSSGKAALVLILKALSSLRPGKRVVIPAYTCYSVPSAILKAGLEIALCDVDPETLDFDFEQLETTVDESTLCVVPTHLFGIPADVERVRTICRGKGAYVVEDAAQSMGVEVDGRMLGAIGDAGFFSFGRGKNLSCGSGGTIITSRAEIAGKLREIGGQLESEPAHAVAMQIAEIVLTMAFLNPALYWFPAGLPFLGIGETRFLADFPVHRLGGFKAGLLGSWREKLEDFNRSRLANGREYIEELGMARSKGIYRRDLPYLRLPVYANSPDGKARICRACGVLGASPMYPGPIHRIEEIRHRFGGREYPGADRVAATLVTLPTHVLVTGSDRKRLCEAIGEMGVGLAQRGPHAGQPSSGVS